MFLNSLTCMTDAGRFSSEAPGPVPAELHPAWFWTQSDLDLMSDGLSEREISMAEGKHAASD